MSVAALKRGKLLDRLAVGFALIGVATPSFLLGLLAILVFGFWLNMVPVNGYVPLTESPVDWAWHLITPVAGAGRDCRPRRTSG